MDALQDEVESLEAILMDDVRITRDHNGVPERIETTIFPVIDDDTDQQYICVTLQVIPVSGYPDVSPEFSLLKPRGLDDGRLNEMKSACAEKLKTMVGCPVVFDLIEVIREHLSGSNLPSGQCVICLYGFTEGDEFAKTECFHYLHSYCLARHFIAQRRNYQEEYDKLPAWQRKTTPPFQAACPVCRESIKDDDSDSLKCAMPPAELQNAPDFKLTDDLKELQRRMASLFLHQKSRGAIIDLDTDGGTTVISIETEEEIRRRQQRKKTTEAHNGSARTQSDVPLERCGAVAEQKTNNSNVASGSATNSAALSDQTMQSPSSSSVESQNTHHHHNRRHYRGGRRHQQHHHHHHRDRDRERERERHENHNSSHSSAAPAAGKQGKGQTACGANTR